VACDPERGPAGLALTGDETRAEWTCKTVNAGTFERVVTSANEGLNQAEIAVELGINKSNVSRHLRRAKAEGRIKGLP